MSEFTPLMRQYRGIKEKHADSIVLFRLGDFYEMFDEDALDASRILQIALTTRDKGKDNPTPMCGIPYFAAEGYISKLIKAGRKVAICEQVEDPKDAKGIVSREVVRIITPGTHVPESPKENSFIFSFSPGGRKYGIAVADVSTGEFTVYESERPLEDELSRFEPREVLIPESLRDDIHYAEALKGYFTSPADDWSYDYAEAYRTLLRHFRVSSLQGFGCEGMQLAVSAAGALVSYVEAAQKRAEVFGTLRVANQRSYMFLDGPTQRNLELVRNLSDGSTEGTLISVMDETLTPMGGRFLRNSILRPLIESEGIRHRLEAVGYIVEDYELAEAVRNSLRKVQDLERLARRISGGSASPRDLAAVKSSISVMPSIRKELLKTRDPLLRELGGMISELKDVHSLIDRAITDNPPASLKDGGVIKKGYDREIDELRALSTNAKDFITRMEAEERKRTGISSLKVGYTRVFGYYIEVTKANLDQVPERYIRKQTLVGGERFITPELKEYESRVLGAEERLKAAEGEAFDSLIEELKGRAGDIAGTAQALAELDFLLSLSIAAKRHDYVMPRIVEGKTLEIVNGRHPVLERMMTTGERFTPNDSVMDENSSMLIITGPNMAGKSTYMRQTALIVLMAQVGSFVPAEAATIGVADRIFTRIGASDVITKGLSTFMVEMVETANILNNATGRSLILLDEVGRGTSTFDGISIAWATAEHIARRIRARTLFATHYNELTDLAHELREARNCNIAVKEWGDEIIFLRKIEDGPADKSYGIQVARLAGLPEAVLSRARAIIGALELHEVGGIPSGKKEEGQLDLFGHGYKSVIEEVANLDTDSLSPAEAVKKLKEIKQKLQMLP